MSDYGSIVYGNRIQYSAKAITDISTDIANKLEYQGGKNKKTFTKKDLIAKINAKLQKMTKEQLKKHLEQCHSKS